MSINNGTKKVADYWNMRGETYSRSWTSLAKKQLSALETDLVVNTIKHVQKEKKGSVKVLDIGIAIGRICQEILKQNVTLYGTDISNEMIRICQEKFKYNNKVIKFANHDILNPIPSTWGKFDVISAIRVIAYSKEWKRELRNIHNALNPGGFFVFTFPNRYSSHTLSMKLMKRPLDGTNATENELRKALEDVGFTKIQISGHTRLLDSFYDWADSKFSSDLLYFIEKGLSKIFGSTLFARLFYIVCQK